MACHLKIDAGPDPVPDPAYHSDADPVPDPAYRSDADPDPDFYLMRMRIQVTKMMWIRIHNTDIQYVLLIFCTFLCPQEHNREFRLPQIPQVEEWYELYVRVGWCGKVCD